MIQLNISEETVKESFQKTLNQILEAGNYNNPVKRILDDMLGYSNITNSEMGKQIKEYADNALKMPSFQAQLGKAIADEMARRAVDAMEKKK